MTSEMTRQLQKYAKHFSNLFDTNCRIVDVANQCFLYEPFGKAPYFQPFCKNGGCNLLHTYLYGCSEAYRWGGKYIYYCQAGFVFIASPVTDEVGNLTGGLVLGPLVMGSMEDTVETFSNPAVLDTVRRLSNVPTDKVNDMAEILAGVTAMISGAAHSAMGSISFKQEDILQSLYEQKESMDDQSVSYPIETEKQLEAVIHNGDKQGAQALLNDLLGKIYVISRFDVETIKVRMVELLAVLSRATIDAGADSSEILWFNTNRMKAMLKCTSIDELSRLITEIMHRFINYSFDFSAVKHSDTVYKVMEYIRQNYYKKITLDHIAQYVSFSKTYLSRIFKEETGENISQYINKVRIEKAKILLANKQNSLVDVANLVGFEDQSYFTKVFKAIVGTSPKKYQESRTKF